MYPTNPFFPPFYGGGMGPGFGGFPTMPGPFFGPGFGPGFFGPGVPYAEIDFVLDDEDIEESVRNNIDLDAYIPRGDKNAINVDVSGGVVKLSGVVKNRRSKPLAFTDAFYAAGVIDVDSSDLKVEEIPRKSAKKEVE